jgi:uncharacterized protein YeaO (DUF488 family)
MPVRSKSVYEDASPDDGLRVLTTNYWPRGVSKERGGKYVRLLAPTRDLLHAFRDGEVSWAEYEQRYLDLMRDEACEHEIARLAEAASQQTVTVMCVCKDDAQCHRRLLRQLVAQRMEAMVR